MTWTQGALSTFQSILYPCVTLGMRTEERAEPDFARDLNLDQIVEAVTAGYDEYDLAPLFYRCLDDPDQIAYRHEVMRDLEKREVRERTKAFLADMRQVRGILTAAGQMYYAQQKIDASSRLSSIMLRQRAGSPVSSPSFRSRRVAGRFPATCLPMSRRRRSANCLPIPGG